MCFSLFCFFHDLDYVSLILDSRKGICHTQLGIDIINLSIVGDLNDLLFQIILILVFIILLFHLARWNSGAVPNVTRENNMTN